MKEIIPIFFATDSNYMPFLDVALKSLVTQASRAYDYRIYILNINLPYESKRTAARYNDKNFKVEFVDMSREIAGISDKLHTRDYYSPATYYRLFIPKMFTQYVKALYLDCDIVLNGDVSELYLTDIGNNYIGAASEEAAHVTSEFSEYAERFLGLAHNAYFNAGVAVMNLDIMRKEDLLGKFLGLLGQCKFTVAQDQDYLNVICKDKVHYLPLIWNKMPLENPEYPLEKIKLIHFKLAYKPWHYDGILYEEVFWKYAAQCGSYTTIVKIKDNYSEKSKQEDVRVIENLRSTALKQANDEDSFFNLLERGKIAVLT